MAVGGGGVNGETAEPSNPQLLGLWWAMVTVVAACWVDEARQGTGAAGLNP
ncbi:MAG TPA: hypothetical protein VK784_16570 [Pseudonocardiaceae bacterium]|nr:hypothetical protein [Pseudonocardiaceae bacterium]